jgi:hypothetical protein
LPVYRIPGYKVKDWVHLIPLPNTYRDSRHREEHMLEDLWDYHARWVIKARGTLPGLSAL